MTIASTDVKDSMNIQVNILIAPVNSREGLRINQSNIKE